MDDTCAVPLLLPLGTQCQAARSPHDHPPRRGSRLHPAQIAQIGGPSLRAGFVTESFRTGADAHAFMRDTGHRSRTVLEGYTREHAPLVNNAVTKLGL